jgi:hypothetical protein
LSVFQHLFFISDNKAEFGVKEKPKDKAYSENHRDFGKKPVNLLSGNRGER